MKVKRVLVVTLTSAIMMGSMFSVAPVWAAEEGSDERAEAG